MTKIGVDTNIFIYTLDSSSPYHERSLAFLKNIENDLFMTSKNISEYFAVCTKMRINRAEMLNFYEEMKGNIIILYPNNDSLKVFEQLNEKYEPKGNRVYDIEIASIFISNNINKLATINVKDFNNISEIEIVNVK